jgi:ATP-dependent RNA helicase RhlE
MPGPIEKLTQEILQAPARITLQEKAAPAEGVTHAAYPVPSSLKTALLVELLKRGHIDDALVFTRTKHRADKVAKLLNRHGIFSERIHGNRSQPQRTKALAGFKAGKYRVLVATDIAARGIDVEALGHVVNFDVPAVPEDYIHRVGRTARADATGEAFTLVAPENEADFGRIEQAVGLKIPRVQLEGFSYEVTPNAPVRDHSPATRAKTATVKGGDRSAEGSARPRRRRFGECRT